MFMRFRGGGIGHTYMRQVEPWLDATGWGNTWPSLKDREPVDSGDEETNPAGVPGDKATEDEDEQSEESEEDSEESEEDSDVDDLGDGDAEDPERPESPDGDDLDEDLNVVGDGNGQAHSKDNECGTEDEAEGHHL